jgi:hypothetical protein
MISGKTFFWKIFFAESIFQCLARTENYKYFYSIILTYKNKFLFKTYKY